MQQQYGVVKIIVLSSRFPYPIEKGDKLRLYYHIKSLSQEHQVYLVSLYDRSPNLSDIHHVEQFVEEIKLIKMTTLSRFYSILKYGMSSMPFQQIYFFQERILAQIESFVQEVKPDHVYCHLPRMAAYLKHVDLPKSIDYMDAFSKGMALRIKNSVFYKKWFYRIEAKRMKDFEKALFPLFQNSFIISQQDKCAFNFQGSEKFIVIPNGVDLDFFQRQRKKIKYDIVFAGNMGYRPNIDAAKYLVNKILPLIKQKGLNPTVLIAGARPSRGVKQLAQNNVIISGWMEDIRDAYYESRVLVAPIYNGIGQQNKILEAMACGTTCITSESVNNAIGAKHGEEILVGHSPEEYAELIVDLLNNPQKSEVLSNNAYTFVNKNYHWTKVNEKFLKYFK